MTKYVATGNGLEVPLFAKTLDEAIHEIERGGRRFCAEQTFDVCRWDDENGRGEEVACLIDADAS